MVLRTLIRDYLKEAKLMQLATSENNQPWVCSVWFAFDEDLHIYWFSSITRRHSDEVSKNPKVAGTIVLLQTPNDPPRGLQFQGEANMVENKEEVERAISLYEGRIFTKERIEEFMSHKEKPHKFYKIAVKKYVLFDAVNFPKNPRQELDL